MQAQELRIRLLRDLLISRSDTIYFVKMLGNTCNNPNNNTRKDMRTWSILKQNRLIGGGYYFRFVIWLYLASYIVNGR